MNCDYQACEALCCYDGAFIDSREEVRIRDVVSRNADFFCFLPDDFIVDGAWCDRSGRKTAVEPFEYILKTPDHFTDTRCVFTLEDGRCSLQVQALNEGRHPWSYKPQACWLFPLMLMGDVLHPPPSSMDEDPCNIGPEYPGFFVFLPCVKGKIFKEEDLKIEFKKELFFFYR